MTYNSLLFIVGCSRGGTTVLHSSLAQSPSVRTGPESFLPYTFVSGLSSRFQKGYNISFRPKQQFLWFLTNMGFTHVNYPSFLNRLQMQNFGHKPPLTVPRYFRIKHAFEAYGKLCSDHASPYKWLEKSPANVFCVDLIERFLPSAKFVHIVRNGKSTVASLVRAGTKYPQFKYFSGPERAPRAAFYWKNATEWSLQCKNKRNHSIISYDELVLHPQNVLCEVANFLDITFCEEMLNYRPDLVARDVEEWKFDQPSMIQQKFSHIDEVLSQREIGEVDRIIAPTMERAEVNLKRVSAANYQSNR